MFFTSTLMFTLIKKTSVHKDTKVVSNQKYDAILGRIYTISHLLSLERSNRIPDSAARVKHFSREDAAFKNEMAPGGVPEAIAKKSHKKTFTLNCCD